MKTIWLVMPCYNEQEVLGKTAHKLKILLKQLMDDCKITSKSKIAFVNDGSKDFTWKCICELYQSDPIFVGINLSKNRGQQNALLAGIEIAKDYADAVITLDVDLQDDITLIEEFINQFEAGYDIVYGVRCSRKKDHFFKRCTASWFYKVMKLWGVEIVYNHAEYRLMSKRVLDEFEKYQEVNMFIRGVIPLLGYPSTIIEYERSEREAGKSKYPLHKMLSLALEGVTSLSVKPIRFISALGIIIFGVSFLMIAYFVFQQFIGNTVSGWASLIVSIWALGGLQLLSIGVIGEYIGKTYLETKHRPRYSIESILHTEKERKDESENQFV